MDMKNNEFINEMAECVCAIFKVTKDAFERLGTGYHYGGGWIITNAHVIKDTETLRHVRLMFDHSLFVIGAEGTLWPSIRICAGRERIEADYQMFYISDFPTEIGSVTKKKVKEQGSDSDTVYVLHYSARNDGCGVCLQLSEGKVNRDYNDLNMFMHSAYTRPGASGSPVFHGITLGLTLGGKIDNFDYNVAFAKVDNNIIQPCRIAAFELITLDRRICNALKRGQNYNEVLSGVTKILNDLETMSKQYKVVLDMCVEMPPCRIFEITIGELNQDEHRKVLIENFDNFKPLRNKNATKFTGSPETPILAPVSTPKLLKLLKKSKLNSAKTLLNENIQSKGVSVVAGVHKGGLKQNSDPTPHMTVAVGKKRHHVQVSTP